MRAATRMASTINLKECIEATGVLRAEGSHYTPGLGFASSYSLVQYPRSFGFLSHALLYIVESARFSQNTPTETPWQRVRIIAAGVRSKQEVCTPPCQLRVHCLPWLSILGFWHE